jgi:O-antigen/teichoic acid export membrane protein
MMLKNIKRLTKQSAVYGFGHILSRSIGFLLLPIHTRNLTLEQYGVVSLLFSWLAILNVLFTYGMDAAFFRFFVLGENSGEKRRVFSTAHWMIFFTGLLFSAVLFLFPGPFSRLMFENANLGRLVRLAAVIVFADALGLMPFLALRAEEKPLAYVSFKSVNIAVTLGLNVLYVVVLKRGVEGVFVSNAIASIFTLLTLIPVFVRWLRPRFRRDILSELLKFGLPYIPAGLAMVIMDQINRIFIGRFMGEKSVGLFSAGYKIGMIMSIAVAAFRFAWHPFFLSASRQPEAPRLFGRVLTYFSLATGFLFLVVSGWTNEIMGIRIAGMELCDAKFRSAAFIVPVVLLSYMAYGYYVNFVVPIYLKKKTGVLPWITGSGALVGVVGNALLIPAFGLAGAAWATFAGYAVMAFILYRVSRSLYPIPYEWGRLAKLGAVIAVLFVLLSAAGRAWYKPLFLAGFPVLLWFVRFFEPQEKAAVRRLLKLK